MKARLTVLVAFLVTVTLTAVAAAGPDAAKQRVAIRAKILPTGVAVLEPLKQGAVERDSGTLGGTWSPTPDRTVIRDGQTVGIYTGVWTFTGERGTIVFRERNEWVDTRDSSTPPWVAMGTWKVVRGTGEYARVAGGGRSGHAGLGRTWYARYEGFLTSP